ncbi:ABC transporter ATP-binding protein [Clostridium hydrogenum]|uniref:ABC transporter ATP-binding protein n=1 Tax=Clostridium hydrogenum TaxID=2855764 RepID=UPI001F19F412|nr:ABC transporter ATP-binding protein [Clostridium hydrogenum]
MYKNILENKESVILKQLISLIKPYKKWIWLSLLCAIVIGISDIISVTLIKQLIDNIHHADNGGILRIIMLSIITVLISAIANYLMPYSSGLFGSNVIKDLRNKTVQHIDKMQVSSKDKMNNGDITSRLNNDISAAEQFIGSIHNYLYIPLVFCVTFIYLFLIQWKLLVASSISIPIALFISNKLSKPMGKLHEEYYKYIGEANSLMQNAIDGINVVKAFNLEKVFQIKCREKLNKSLEIYDNKINFRGALIMPVMFMIYELPYVICAAYGGYLAVKGNIKAGSLVAFLLLLQYLVNPMSQLPNLIVMAKSAMGAFKRIFELFELKTEYASGTSFSNIKEEFDIEFEDVIFGYNENEKILNKVSFKLKKGSTVAIVGPSGAGKSTIINLICRFYEINKGVIKLYGEDIKAWNLVSLRKQLGFVSQDTYLYPGSIMDNIRFGKLSSTDEEVISAAKEANAHDFILKLQNGYDALVSERGIKLSGGQKQRIAIARAILKNAPILLLDEPTSALDTESEAFIQKSLQAMISKKTKLIIAHRLNTIEQADLILVLNNGSIVQSGTHDELLSKEGLYKQLYQRHFYK